MQFSDQFLIVLSHTCFGKRRRELQHNFANCKNIVSFLEGIDIQTYNQGKTTLP